MATKEVGVRLRVGAEGLDNVSKLTGELRRAGGETERFDAAAGELNTELARLTREQTLIDTFRRTALEAKAAGEQLDAARVRTAALGRELAATEAPTKRQTAAFERSRVEARGAAQAYQDKRLALQNLRGVLGAAGISSDQLAAAQVRVRQQTAAARTSVTELTTALTAETQAARSAAAEQQKAAATITEAKRAQTAAAKEQAAEEDRLARIVADTQRAQAAAAQQQLAAERQAVAEAVQLTQRLQAAREQATRDAIADVQRLAAATEQARASFQRADAAVDNYRDSIASLSAPTEREARSLASLTERARQAQLQLQRSAQAQAQGVTAARAAGAANEQLAAAQGRVVAQSQRTELAADRVSQAYREQGTAAQRSAAQQVSNLTPISAAVQGLGQQLQGLQRLAGIAIGGTILTNLVADVGRTADAYKDLAARIRLVTGEGAAFDEAFEGVLAIAQRTNTALDATGTLFARVAAGGKELGISQRQALALTETLNQAFQLSGGSAESQNAAIRQLIQGLGSGVVRGEEFNSVAEQGRRVTEALADALGVTNAELRKLAESGELTTEVVLGALASQAQAIGEEFEKLPLTISRASTNLSSSFQQVVGELDKGVGASEAVANALDLLAKNLDTVIGLLGDAGQAFLVLRALKIADNILLISTAARAAAASTAAQTAATAGLAVAQRGQAVAAGQATAANVALAGSSRAATASNAALAASSVAVGAASAGSGAAVGGLAARLASLASTVKLLVFATVVANIKDIGTAIGETIARLAGADDELKKATEASQLRAAGLAADARQQAASFEEFRNQAVLTAAQVSKLGEQERIEYRRRLEGRLEFERLSLRAALNEQQAGRDTAAVQEQLRARLQETNAALELLTLSSDELAKVSTGPLSTAARQLILDFDKLRSNGDSAADAITSIGKDFDASSIQGIRDFGQVLAELGMQGKASAEQIRSAYADALKGEDLLLFETRARAAFAGAQNGGEALAQALDARLREAVRRTGLDFQELETGVSDAARSAINNVNLIADSADQLAERGIEVGDVLAAAFDKATEVANTTEALEELREATVAAGKAGQLTGDQYADALGRIERKLRDLDPAFQRLEQDAKALGVTLGIDVTRSLEQVVRGYENVRQSGLVSATQLTTAFKKYAADVIEANNGIVPEFLKVEAAAQNVSVGVDEAGRAIVRSLDEGGRSAGRLRRDFDDVRGGVDQLGESVGRLGDRIRSLPDARKLREYREALTDASGFVLGDDGQVLQQLVQPGPPRQLSPVAPGATTGGIGRSTFNAPPQLTGGLTGAQRDEYYNYLVRVGAVPQAFIAAGFTPPANSERQVAPGGAARSTSAPAPAPAVAPQSQTVRVEISTDGRSRAPIQVASQADASALVALLRELESAQRASGIG